MSRGETSPQLIDTAERRAFLLRARKRGATMRMIADAAVKEYGYDKLPQGWDSRYVAKDIQRELDRIRTEIAEDASAVIQLELARLDDLLFALWSRATGGDEKAVDRVLRIMQRRADLLGLDAPKRQELTGADGGPVGVTVTWEEVVVGDDD